MIVNQQRGRTVKDSKHIKEKVNKANKATKIVFNIDQEIADSNRTTNTKRIERQEKNTLRRNSVQTHAQAVAIVAIQC
jgi:hypothetical protein